MPYFPDGNLRNVVRQLHTHQIREAFRQTILALEYFHDQRVVHRDVKPANILVQQKDPIRIVLADFGFVSLGDPKTTVGTEGYMAPEIAYNREFGKVEQYTSSVDIYALGISLLECLQVKVAARSNFDETRYFRNVGKVLSEALDHSDDIERRSGIQLAGEMVSFKPGLRPTAKDCRECRTWLSRWTSIPIDSVPPICRDFEQFEAETRPQNNPIEALSLEHSLNNFLPEQVVNSKRRTEYLAFILRNFTSKYPGLADCCSRGPTVAETRICQILETLPAWSDDDSECQTMDITEHSDRIPRCMTEYTKKLHGQPDWINKMRSLARALASDPVYTNDHVSPPNGPQSADTVRQTSWKDQAIAAGRFRAHLHNE